MKIIASIVAGLAASCALGAAAQPRNIVVNGYLLDPVQVAQIQLAQCGYVPDGAYWLDMRTGAWGYAGSAWRQGFVGDRCRGGGTQAHRGLSQRGLLYTPGDLRFR